MCQETCAKNTGAVSKASKREIIDFTDSLERVLICAYKVCHPTKGDMESKSAKEDQEMHESEE